MNVIRDLWRGFICLVLAATSIPVAAQTVEYIHTDALGTPVAVTNSARVVIERSEYEPYGLLLNRPITDGPGFTGHVQDAATGLTYMQQRYYDPGIGMMLSVDPVTAYGGDLRHFNRYAYAYNNPYKFTDPDGRCPACDGFGDAFAKDPGAFEAFQPAAVSITIGAVALTPVVGPPAAMALRAAAKSTEGQPKGAPGRAGQNGVEGPPKVETRTTRSGEEAASIRYPDGSIKDVSPTRVKESVPNTHPNAPAGAQQRVKFKESQPGTKGYKRDPTPQDLKDAGIKKP